LGGPNWKKKVLEGLKLEKKNNKIWGKILIFLIFFGENFGGGGQAPKPLSGSAIVENVFWGGTYPNLQFYWQCHNIFFKQLIYYVGINKSAT
jgi:hypothetical protein